MTDDALQAGVDPVDVSVIVPAWRAADFIDEAIRSALQSRSIRLELIAVDDASPDGTFAVLQKIAAADPRVRVDRLSVNGGPSAARNRAIELSSGRYVAVLDADDAMDPDRLARLVALGDSTGVDIIVDNLLETGVLARRDLRGGARYLRAAPFDRSCDIDLETYARECRPMHAGAGLGYLKPLFRRASLERLSERYDPALRNSEDYYLVANLLAKGARMIYSPEPGYFYRREEGSTSHRMSYVESQTWLDAEAKFRAAHASTFTSNQIRVLDRRARALNAVHQYMLVLEALKGKRLGAFFQILASNPDCAPFILWNLVLAARDKTARRLRRRSASAAAPARTTG